MAQFDNYLDCEQYAAAPDSEKNAGFKTWFDADSNAWYFGVVTNRGRVVLRSEAYTTESARDNGIDSVIRNRDIEARYSVVQEADGKWYVILKAGNHQEIARSCAYDSEAAAREGIAACFSTYTERAAAANRVVDNYLACEQYAAAPASEKYAGFKSWHDDETNSDYFAVVTDTGRVVLRSEAYTTPAARDNGIESVIKNRDIEARYAVTQDETDGKWYVILKAGNHQEIARSCAYDSEAAARTGIASSFSTYSERKGSSAAHIEDYLPCEAYSNKPATSKYEGFTTFRDEETNQYYFAMVDKNGKVLLKSEGYKASESRDNGIESVIRNRNIEERWIKSKDDGGHYMSLRAGNKPEIARTCHFESEGAMMGWWMPFSAAAFAAPITVAPVVETAKPEPVIVAPPAPAPAPPPPPPPPPAPKPEPVVVSTAKPTPPPVTSYKDPEVVAAAGSSGGNWWKWLLPLLLLLGLFLLWRSCGGCNKPEATKVSVAPPPPPPVAAPDTAKAVVPAAAPAAAAVCNCNAATDPVFRLSNGTPKSLHRLGTNPEFGNSHDLSPAQFYDKLASQHRSNAVDKKFLDRMFKAMGYADGFASAKPEMFTAVELPAGTVGNIGYSKAHKTLYARLDTEGKDLMAFRIKAANGCDLHFMKTCGNHFFFCEK
jgi:uncharacterized protein YegP (UPF0339 family)